MCWARILLIFLGCVVSARAAERNSTGAPYIFMRQAEDILGGSAFHASVADEQLKTALSRFVEALNSSPTFLADRRNRNAVATFLVTGGDEQTVRKAISDKRLLQDEAALLENVVLYAEGAPAAQLRPFLALRPREAPPEVSGALALAQARELMASDAAAAKEKLKEARMLAPGGLVEEAALRLELFVPEKTIDFAQVGRIARRYFARFPGSAFVENFETRFRKIVGDAWKAEDGQGRSAAIQMLEELPESRRASLALQLARHALVTGDKKATLDAVRVLCGAGPKIREAAQQCQFYETLLSVFASPDAAVQALTVTTEGIATEELLLRVCLLSLIVAPSASNPSVSHDRRREGEASGPADESISRIRERINSSLASVEAVQ